MDVSRPSLGGRAVEVDEAEPVLYGPALVNDDRLAESVDPCLAMGRAAGGAPARPAGPTLSRGLVGLHPARRTA